MKVKIIYTSTVEKEIEVHDVYEVVNRADCPQEIHDLFVDRMCDIALEQEGYKDMERILAFNKDHYNCAAIF